MNLQEVIEHNRRVPVPGYASHNLGASTRTGENPTGACASVSAARDRARPSLSTYVAKPIYNRDIILAFLKNSGIPLPVFEFRFCARRWRFDLAWPEQKLALEVQGGIFTQGRHTRGAALLKEWLKLNTAATMGWRLLYCQPKDLLKRDMATMIFSALNP